MHRRGCSVSAMSSPSGSTVGTEYPVDYYNVVYNNDVAIEGISPSKLSLIKSL
jgi:hypothetical protein